MPHKSDLASSLSLLEDPEKLRNIGSAIVKEAITRAVMRKAKAGALKNNLVIAKGEYVPKSLQEAMAIEVDAEGKAVMAWPPAANGGGYFEGCYEDSGWGYCECWPDTPNFEQRIMEIARSRLQGLAGLSHAELHKSFTKDEIKLLEKYHIMALTQQS